MKDIAAKISELTSELQRVRAQLYGLEQIERNIVVALRTLQGLAAAESNEPPASPPDDAS